jgi:SAM-dependent methyltransferase
MEWILAHWKPGQPIATPGRLLVAGCGTGAEAVALSRRFPHAEIVAVDFSPRSIAIARQYQQGVRNRGNIRFVVADLSTRGLNRLTGVDFDIVFCHGVLGYVPGAGSTLRNLSQCLSPDGALYLGVNGTRHVSVGLRAVLPTFGLDVSRFTEGPQAREVLSLCDAILGHRNPEERMATRPAAYLASDVFGELIQNRPLSTWVRAVRTAGLYFQSSLSAHRELRPLVERGLCERLLPRSRARVCHLLDALRPAAFHMLLFTRQPVVNPPWSKPREVEDWHPVLTGLYPLRRRPSASASAARLVTLDSRAMNTRIQWPMSWWQRALLREADGMRSVRQILGPAGAQVPTRDVSQYLYVLHLLAVVAMRPPDRAAAANSQPATRPTPRR